MVDIAEISKLGSTPIPGDTPVGTDSKYDEDYEALKTEIGKLETDPSSVEWRQIVELGTTLLSTKTKDLQIACYYTAALWNQDSWAGLSAGITIIKEMVETYWDDCFPPVKRMRGRVGALNWISDRVEKMMPAKSDPGEGDRDALTAALKGAEDLDQMTREKTNGEQTTLSILIRLIREQLDKVPQPAPEPEPEPEAPPESETPKEEPSTPEPEPQPEPEPVVEVEIDSAEGAKEALETITKKTVEIANQLIKGEPTNPFGYRLLRTTLWSQLEELPKDPEGGGSHTLGDLEEKLEEKDFPACIELAETNLVDTPFWLDLNFFTVRAMEGMGYIYDEAREEIGKHVAGLVLRAPHLLEGDGNEPPETCSDETRMWIKNDLLAGILQKPDPEVGMTEAVSKAKKLVSRKKLADAIAIIDHGLKSAGDRREKFLWKLHLAQICVQGKKPNLATPLADTLNREAEKFCLEEWETDLAIEALKVSVQCARAEEGDEAETKAKELYARLSSIDLSAALALDGKKIK